jgi:flagellin-like protein
VVRYRRLLVCRTQEIMKEKIKQFVADKRGVSPVIGVVLMVAVVVILAAVIGAFVLGLGGDQQAAPQASFTYDGTNLVHDGGNTIPADELSYSVSGGTASDWGGTGDVSAGSSTAVTATAGDTIRVIWTSPDGGDTSTIATINV